MDAAGARLVDAARLRVLCARARFHRARLDRARRRVATLEVTWSMAARDLRDAGDVWAAGERARG